jgi:hypothetical protein
MERDQARQTARAPTRSSIAIAMHLAMVEATARDGAFIADFLRPSARLRKAKMGDPP